MLKTIVLQQKEERDWLLSKEYQKRISDADNNDYLQSPLIKLISGPRRAGKSVYALQLLENQNFAYLNFDDDLLLKNFDENQLLKFLLEVYPDFKYLFLDEIQNLQGWDIWVGKLYRRGINLIITGSNAKLLSNEMATVLTGRYLKINIFPFSFSEMIAFRKFEMKTETPAEKAESLLQLSDYMKSGGFPETIQQRSITKNYLGSLFDSILLKDVTKRYNIRNISELYNIASYLLTNFCNSVSFNQLANELGLGSINTAKKFCQYLSEPYLFFYLPRFNSKLKQIQKAPQKIYTIDNGFISVHSFDLSPNLGRLLENLVFTEFIRRGYIAGQSLFYYRSRNDREIDFVCKTGYRITELVQVSYDISVPKTYKREISALTEASQELKCDSLLLITWDTEQCIEEDNLTIKVIPVWKWLLEYSL